VELNQISGAVLDSAMKVHTALGPGLLESTYEVCLAFELADRGLQVRTQVALPVVYRSVHLEAGYRLDLLVEDSVIVELKAIESVLPIHEAQLLSYLKLSGKKLGLLINFNVVHLKDGIKRMVNRI
jgi:GxxExxY protein